MIFRALLLLTGLSGLYVALSSLHVHLYVTWLMLFIVAGPLSYLIFREEAE
ncbi:MAG TPA: hypothetical protein K8W01_19595 [Methylorubrum populi]|uniref:Uncharacterized protein n=1 Tax=Methylorubrum populi TaxID=223967 RepID=A0A921E6C5_9HYPH|nr:hypothetical protein [Methylorubrum populi]